MKIKRFNALGFCPRTTGVLLDLLAQCEGVSMADLHIRFVLNLPLPALDSNSMLFLDRLGSYTFLPHTQATRETFEWRTVTAVKSGRVPQAFERDLGHIPGFSLNSVESVIHPSAVIAESVNIGPATWIHPNVTVSFGSRIGAGVSISRNCSIGHHCIIENLAQINPGAHLSSDTVVKSLATVGIGASTRQGVVIGAGAFVGAGAAVIADVPPGVVVVGVPAKIKS